MFPRLENPRVSKATSEEALAVSSTQHNKITSTVAYGIMKCIPPKILRPQMRDIEKSNKNRLSGPKIPVPKNAAKAAAKGKARAKK